ncbi:MAG: hypothetical protein A2V66_06450 [Ignavibacteria bacterium RBG_13_36_8]|nr:MAG: hypothetical protein A2V66_06450 [Ignavibacteria bacterium RBG_13_36_8]
MLYEEKLENVSVLGAAGKMGSGILLLTALEMMDQILKLGDSPKNFLVYAIDISEEALSGLMQYLKVQVQKTAEKKTVSLRKYYKDRKDLVENSEIIDQYTDDVLNLIRPVTTIESAYNSNLIFEAISENPELKIKILSGINENNNKSPWFFTNTSSIPINLLDEKAKLDGRILGFHFYNPPAVQKLVELIVTNKTKKELIEFAHTYAGNLRKKIVPSNDFAGFIGNGHFMRDALHGIHEAERLSADRSFAESIYIMNKISQDYLLRPMGIFQLIDYVGIDVCQYIMKVMNPYLPDEDLHSNLLDQYISINIKGGQKADGSQKNGFLKYEKGKPIAIYDPQKKDYILISYFQEKANDFLGESPKALQPWKSIIAVPNKNELIKNYFKELESIKSHGADLTKKYAKRSREIGLKLVKDKVANKEEDVNTVLLTGFYHAFGPINDYLNWEVIK